MQVTNIDYHNTQPKYSYQDVVKTYVQVRSKHKKNDARELPNLCQNVGTQYSAILSGMYFGILSREYFDILSRNLSGTLSGILFVTLSGKHSDILSGNLSGNLSDSLSGMLSELLTEKYLHVHFI